MVVVAAFAMFVLGYLSGSVNYAIVVTRLLTGKDIRTMGNKNPGTANVGRSVGKQWAAVVFVLDVFKAVGPMLLTRLLLYSEAGHLQVFAVAAVGLAAILGHCKPVFFSFRGGGGIATSVGVYSLFVPVELLLSMILGFAIVMLFIRRVRFRIGRWIPIVFVTLTPFLTLALNYLVDVPLGDRINFGGHPWYVLAVVFAISLFILAMNFSFMGERLNEIKKPG